MSFKIQMQVDLAVFFNSDEFAREIIYKGLLVLAIVNYFRNLDITSSDLAARAEIIVKREHIPNPRNMDFVFFDSLSWNVEAIESGDELTWHILVRRAETIVF